MGKKTKSRVKKEKGSGSGAFNAPTHASVMKKRMKRYSLREYKKGFVLVEEK